MASVGPADRAMTTATSTSTTSTTEQWYDAYNPLPRNLVLAKIPGLNGQSITFAVKNGDLDESLRSMGSTTGYGLKLRDSTKYKAAKRVLTLGTYPKNLCGKEWSNNNKAFPPISSVSTHWCQATNMHPNHESSMVRETHVEKESTCFFSVTVRALSLGDVTLLTVDRDRHNHNCKGVNRHLLPLTALNKLFFAKGLLAHDSVEDFHAKVLALRALRCMSENLRPSRMDIMTLPDAKQLARKLGLKTTARQGKEDFNRVRDRLVALREAGATVAFKEPGCSVDHPRTILDGSAKTFLQNDDLFIFVTTKLQGRLLKRYGKMVSTDGTHAVFSYGSIKLIVVMVTSFSSAAGVRERGFPVAFALTTSEREDVHKAIVAHLLAAVPEWMPELLMTDMAFSAFNAWRTFFPNLRWLWCVFHVWQAWIRRLKRMQRPDGVSRDDFSVLKGFLISRQ
jgi:hypothetical protein